MQNEEQIYRIVDTETGKVLMTGRTNKPIRRAKQYGKYVWWRQSYQLAPYRTIERDGRTDEEYGLYAACVEHMEICRNRTWDVQGGRNQMSPVRQMLWGPEARSERNSISARAGLRALVVKNPNHQQKAGLLAGAKNVVSGHIQKLGKVYGRANGLIQGNKHAKNKTGVCGRTPEQMTLDGLKSVSTHRKNKTGVFSIVHQRTAGVAGGRKSVESGHLASLRTHEHQVIASYVANHNSWHVIGRKNGRSNKWVEPRPNSRCELCIEQGLVIAFA